MTTNKRICVFCASANGTAPEYLEAAQDLGRKIAEAQIGLVFGGATVGLMGAVADAALAAGGEVIGIIPDIIMDREIGHKGVTELHVVKTMHERKALMSEKSDAFVALPGGFGTLEEFIEIVTWAQLSIHSKPCVLVNINGYYDGLLAFLDHAVEQGLIQPKNRRLVQVADNAAKVLEIVEQSWNAKQAVPRDAKLEELVK
jgi:uncharacterized protein (TIGR00730 family)